MKKLVSKLLLFIPIISLCSCGYRVREIFDYSDYNDEVFVNNYYRVYSEGIAPGSKNVNELEEYVLDDSKDYVFTSFDDDNLKFLELGYEGLQYEDSGLEDDDKTAIGDARKLSLSDDTFKQGYVSKLFDGQMFCNGRFQKARIQIDEGGFGTLFQKEIGSYSYFAMNFKASFDYTTEKKLESGCKSNITLKIGFYLKNSIGTYDHKVVKYSITNVPTNTGDGHNSKCYMFFGFKLGDNINIDRCCGLSISYTLDSGTVVAGGNTYNKDEAKENGISHSLMLYEVFMPGSTWH